MRVIDRAGALEQQRQRVADIAAALDHWVEPDEACEDLVRTVLMLPAWVSVHRFDGPTPRDLPNWAQTRGVLEKLRKKLKGTIALIDELEEQELFYQALGHLAVDPRVYDWIDGTRELHQTVDRLAAIHGHEGKGNGHETWKDMAVDSCSAFWRAHVVDEPTYQDPTGLEDKDLDCSSEGKFHKNGGPANHFTEFFCELMELAHGLTLAECRTLLDPNRAR